jgi:hypothetical protein
MTLRLPPKGLARPNADRDAERGNHSRWSELAMIRPIMASPPPPARTGAGPEVAHDRGIG